MLEIHADFYSQEDWRSWRTAHESHFDEWRQNVLQNIRRHGLVEPITNARYTEPIVIDEKNLRETISIQEMNSRKRATLLCLEFERGKLPPDSRQNPKILGTEALTRVARVLRGRFSYYLGTEYLPTAEEQRRHFPVQHVDLTKMGFDRDVFDLFHSGDVFEHVPDLASTLSEIARVLKPGGIAVSSFPFRPEQSSTEVKARFVNGEVEHLAPPEIHGNPARPSEGSLVFSLPAWDVLDLCKACGFAEAKMTFVASSTYGVTCSLTPGIFVLSARKTPKEGTTRLPHRSRDTVYAGADLRQVIGLLALPRSGTTLVSSIMGAHSRIKSVYEPWNDKKRVSLPDNITIGNFLDVFSVDMARKSILFVKETATHIDYIDKMLDLLRSVPIAIQTNLVYLLRNPLHVFLSEVEARKIWWGEDDLELTLEVFDRWAERTLASLRRMFRAGAEFNPLLVSYEALVTDKEIIVKRLTERLGIRFEAAQLSFEKTVNKLDVRGDPKLSNNPTEINTSSIQQRQRQISDIEHIVAGSRYRDMLAAVGEAFEAVRSSAVLQLNSPIAQQIFKQMMSKIATPA